MSVTLARLAYRIRRLEAPLQEWVQARLGRLPPPVYSSVDIRNSGFKIAVVDTNLFPAGFNNLCETFSERAVERFRTFFAQYAPQARRVLILPEDHTRNLYYWKNISALVGMLRTAGLSVEVGSSAADRPQPSNLSVRPIQLVERRLVAPGFDPDLILVNNDLSTGVPDYLKDLSQTVLPSPRLGWHARRKSDHFRIYDQLVTESAHLLDLDPWIFSPMTAVETGVDLEDGICLKRLQETANRLLAAIGQKYQDHGIEEPPYLFIKNNAGTYGMGILHVRSGSEILSLNRRQKNRLGSSKGGRVVNEFLLQEGIPTSDRHDGRSLEPVVYLVGGEAVGSFFRVHTERDAYENLNVPGMSFSCLCLHKIDDPQRIEDLFTVCSWLGRVASLAASLELEASYSA